MNTFPKHVATFATLVIALGLHSCMNTTRPFAEWATAETPPPTTDVAVAARETLNAAIDAAPANTLAPLATPTQTSTGTPTDPPTDIPTGTPIDTPTEIPTRTPDLPATQTGVAQELETSVAATLTALPTHTPVPTQTPTSTPTPTLTPTPTIDAASTERALAATVAATLTAQPTNTPRPPPTDPPPAASDTLRLAYVHGDVRNTDIHVQDWLTGETTVVASRVCDEAEPAWSPAGDVVAYHADCNGSYDIYRVHIHSLDVMRLTTGSQDEREPAFSPDGARIVLRVNASGSSNNVDGNLWIMNADGSGSTSLDVSGRAPAWSPTGRYLAFMSNRGGNWQIYQYDLQSGATTQLTTCSANCRFPAWSPGGDYVAYHATQGPGSVTAESIWIVPVGGGPARQIITENNPGRATWSGAGWMAFNSTSGIEVVRVDEQANVSVRQVWIDSEQNWAPVWSH